MLPLTGLERAAYTAERLRESVAGNHFEGIGQLTISIGVAEYHKNNEMISLIEQADTALYQAKNKGRNQVAVYDNSRSHFISDTDLVDAGNSQDNAGNNHPDDAAND
ncbi:GGDEF domain-containing protein [Candidatus Venteria ishoeyi]|uniref:diguanylate cyclase n=2 Tax=Candidatus Venteria ishoeyi TaxID=1899563 RepID=A0A1H6FDZ8_9GAMM|nr:diguanylate cyclase [Candidatus Venteria ishoeyi]SEH07631.1 putative diguanylate cyclase YdaM [Candidatus Venteria ishoeyi]